MSTATLGLAFLAGILSILSPCVLPLLPLVLGSAAAEHRWAPVALAAGVGLAFALIGGVLAGLGFAAGLEGTFLRPLIAFLLVAIGAVLLVPRLQTGLSLAAGPFGNWAQRRFGGFSTGGVTGQFALGVLLGAVWTPCVGPTLGAASLLAARGQSLPAVFATMLLFGLGTGLALAAFGLASRAALLSWRGSLMGIGRGARLAMGGALILIGLVVATGLEKAVEAWLVEASPLWLTQLTTQF